MFRKNEIAIIIGVGNSGAPDGTEVEIMSERYMYNEVYEVYGYDIHIPGFPSMDLNKLWFKGERTLRKLPPPNKKTEWEDCVFKPREVIYE